MYILLGVWLRTLPRGGHKPGKPGILRDFSEHGKLGGFSGNCVQPWGKIVTNIKCSIDWANILDFSVQGLGLQMNKVS